MTTHDRDKVISAAKASRLAFQSDVMLSLDELEAFYAIAHEAGRQAERKECEAISRQMCAYSGIDIADAIRIRSTK